ncbi:MAG: hypothetical protein MdMp014T_0282 [Treponematales bacterium]
MKGVQTILTVSLLLLSVFVHAQTYKLYQTDNIHNQLRLNTKTGEVYQVQDDGQTFLVHPATTPNNNKSNRYALYKTKNIWTFILLDTFTGKLWQCQFSVEGTDYIFSIVINPYSLSFTERSKFTIEPLVSMFQYYLINEETGKMWKFQWSAKGDDYRWIEEY